MVDRCAEAIAAGRRRSAPSPYSIVDPARQRAQDRAAEELIAAPLHGLPVGVKDLFDTADLPTVLRLADLCGHRPVSDAALVSMIRRAGGLLFGKTVMTPLAFLDPAGTRNPHHPRAYAGRLLIGLGGRGRRRHASDCGRQPDRRLGHSPAAYLRDRGLQTFLQTVADGGVQAFAWSLDTVGLFAASTPMSPMPPQRSPGADLRVDRAPPAAPRIALVERRPHRAWARTGEAGAPISDAFRHVDDSDSPPRRAQAAAARLARPASKIGADDYDSARRTARRARQALADLMTDTDVLITPSAPGAAPKTLNSTGVSTFNRLWTLMGAPCINVAGSIGATAARRAGCRAFRARSNRRLPDHVGRGDCGVGDAGMVCAVREQRSREKAGA